MPDREPGHYVNIEAGLRKYRRHSTRLPRVGLERLRGDIPALPRAAR